ncbi:gamma-glutamyltransferase [uncultured Amnibacterium sp.]|uniref:gamma-glutamyltransferase n=1 Tax=uncultured Amnibacterium sp. TaxID=1631851 RepID=UPI0035CADEEE
MSVPRTIRGARGAASTAHPDATRAALGMLDVGGSAVDAAIAAQAVIAVVMPHAAGLGGDLLALVRTPAGAVVAVNGVGRSPALAPSTWGSDGGSSVTVPGLVDGWFALHARGGRLPLPLVLEPAMRLAVGHVVDEQLAAAVEKQRARLERYGRAPTALLQAEPGVLRRQPELAALLDRIGSVGPEAFYRGSAAAAIVSAVAATGGTLSDADLAAHRTSTPEPLGVPWYGGKLVVQPPPSQGVLLAMAAAWLDRRDPDPSVPLQHLLVELVESVYEYREKVTSRGADLLRARLYPDLVHASRRGGARAYLHTAGVAVADVDGTVVSSLISVFDDFGSAVFVPELGIVLANRAAGFTTGANAPGTSRYPVHTLAPAMVLAADGGATGLATPGADGQIQTLLQILAAVRFTGCSFAEALDRPRWRSEDGRLLIEAGHEAGPVLATRGHDLVTRSPGNAVFGAVVVAGVDATGPFAAGDRRRDVRAGGTP